MSISSGSDGIASGLTVWSSTLGPVVDVKEKKFEYCSDRTSEKRKITEKKKHYDNTPILYTGIFFSCKNDNFQLKSIVVFLIFAHNIDCGYTLEPPH